MNVGVYAACRSLWITITLFLSLSFLISLFPHCFSLCHLLLPPLLSPLSSLPPLSPYLPLPLLSPFLSSLPSLLPCPSPLLLSHSLPLSPPLPSSSDYKEYHTDTTVKFVVTLSQEKMQEAERIGFHKKFKLESSLNTSNMVSNGSKTVQ